MNNSRLVFCFLLLLPLVIVSHAQDAHQSTAQSNSTPASATDSKNSSDRVVIKVGDVQVTEAEFESRINDIEPQGGDPDKAASEKDRARLGDDYASVLMLSQVALANHLDESPEIRRKLAVARLQILSDAQFTQLLSETKASPEDLNRYYEAHLSDYDRAKIQRLFIWKVGGASKNSNGVSDEEAKKRAAAVMQSSGPGSEGMKLAQQLADSNQGIFDSQPLSFVRGELPAKLDSLAFTLKPGQWGQAEDTPDHIILVYVAGRDRERLAEVTPVLEQVVQGLKMQERLNELRKKVGVWKDEQYFGRGNAEAKETGEQRPADNQPSRPRKSASLQENDKNNEQ